MAGIQPPQFSYIGAAEFQPQADAFVAQLIRDPRTMAAGLNLVANSPVPVDQLRTFLGGEETRRAERIEAFLSAATFTTLVASGDFQYDRPTERLIASDDNLKDLLRAHRATASHPGRQAELSRQIRARRLAIYASSLAQSQTAAQPAA